MAAIIGFEHYDYQVTTAWNIPLLLRSLYHLCVFFPLISAAVPKRSAHSRCVCHFTAPRHILETREEGRGAPVASPLGGSHAPPCFVLSSCMGDAGRLGSQ
ncbi:hypothetical protein MTO96_016341 [Rhipicephalus appendiculatus]